ncbi:Phospholipid hydroperoxide glutathione peroxidase, chloroplastic [Gracilariopsis chorda]|uniref:Glutathione peroxidase n=1 Tax=Gracilariopsis chorda TaxID=448386 RepID=A0A2V3IRX6_9FLOR|nr:Phospholipid hydroperoxide glutathione peroxidase, chloroplastic [Gracilariopsis chorda]|eukprot:PXF44852.1 Phospholipid hydroperoxide glutathione peroxidase, chloroplastic [Gracilariopsis chorda]
MRMRRGFKPNPRIPRTVFDADPIRDIDTEPFDFSTLKGQVVFIVNVASEDNATDEQYQMLSKLMEDYHGSGLEILAFPSNWYGQKETKSFEEIKKFVYKKYNKNIKLFTKTDLEWNQLFALGTRYFPGEIIWNFHGKFLFNRNGVPVGRYDLLTTHEFLDEEIKRQIQGGYDVMPDPKMETKEDEFDLEEFMKNKEAV